MSTFTPQTKSSDVPLKPMTKAGSGWDYDDPELTYDGEFDPHGRRVLYDSIGTLPVFSGQAKSADVTLTPSTKS